MKTKTSQILRSILGLGLSVLFLVACDERERDRSGTGAATWLASDNSWVLAGDADYESRSGPGPATVWAGEGSSLSARPPS